MLFTDKTQQAVWDTVKEAKKRVRAEYVRHVTMLLDMYHGDHASWMEGTGDPLSYDDELGSTTAYFQKFFPNAWDSGTGNMIGQYLPLAQRVVDSSCTLFHRPPKLFLGRKGKPLSSSDPQAETWKYLQEETDLNSSLKHWQRMTYLCKTTLLFPAWQYGRMDLEILTPDSFWVWENENAPRKLNQCKLVMHELSQPVAETQASDRRRFVVWEKGWDGKEWSVRITDLYGRDMPNTLFPEGINRYGDYPYIVARHGRPRYGFYSELDDTLLMGQVGLDLLWTDGHLAMRTEHGGQAFLKTMDQVAKSGVRGRDRMLVLGPEDEFGYAQTQFGVEGFLQYIDTYLRTHAVMKGLHPDIFAVNGQMYQTAVTAVAKAMDRLDLQETRQDQEAYWEGRLKAMWYTLRKVWNTHVPSQSFDDDVELLVEWAQPEAAVDPLTAAQAKLARINANLTTAARELSHETGRSLAECEVEVLANAEFNARVQATLGQGLRQTPESATNFQSGGPSQRSTDGTAPEF